MTLLNQPKEMANVVQLWLNVLIFQNLNFTIWNKEEQKKICITSFHCKHLSFPPLLGLCVPFYSVCLLLRSLFAGSSSHVPARSALQHDPGCAATLERQPVQHKRSCYSECLSLTLYQHFPSTVKVSQVPTQTTVVFFSNSC